MAHNDINHLLDMLSQQIETAPAPTVAWNFKRSMIVVDREAILELIDELREEIPNEVKRAQDLIAARDKFVDDAKRDVDRMLRQAEQDARTKVSESEVLYTAREQARALLSKAEERSRLLTRVANDYAEDALARTEEAVQAALDEIKESRARFRTVSTAKLQEQRDRLDGHVSSSNADEPDDFAD